MPADDSRTAEPAIERIEALHALMVELETVLQTIVLNDSTIIDGLVQLLGTVQQIQARTEQSLTRLANEVQALGARVGGPPSREPVASVGQDLELARTDPEIGLLIHLHAYLANPVAFDVGANVGRVAERLLRAGYEVFAFEPHRPAFDALTTRLRDEPGLRAFQVAIGAADGTGKLNIAADLSEKKKWDTSLYHSLTDHPMLDDLRFTTSEEVEIRSLGSLAAERKIPADAAVLKIDTEGQDLNVVRGLGDGSFDVIVTEFWDAAHPFGLAGHARLADMVAEMHRRGYRWHLVIYRVDQKQELSFFANRDTAPAELWGNAIFFRDHAIFARAYQWCEDVLVLFRL